MPVRHLLMDGDGCPVVRQAAELAKRYGVPSVVFCDTAHQIVLDGVETVTVSKGADSADFVLLNRVRPADIVVTQDYGLAALCLTKGAVVLNQDGKHYTAENIDGLLYTRYIGKKVRKAGGRLKGPPKRRPEQDEAFCQALDKLLRTKE